jgi:ribosomal-protein-alanine N-acetyltransferase
MRPFEAGDLAQLIPIYGDHDVMAIRKLGVQSPAQTETQLAGIMAHWQRHGFGIWALIDRDSGALLGECGLRTWHEGGDVEISYGLAKIAWGRGLATEASFAALDFGFHIAGLEEIAAIAQATNKASHRVMEKLGMDLQGTWESDGVGLVRYSIRKRAYWDQIGV